ncbi:MAG: MBL fold metallo-hydrolase [Acidobacteriota bacterium]
MRTFSRILGTLRSTLSLTLLIAAMGCAAQAQQSPAARPLTIYWIDVEGGASTLIVSPTGESLLVDTGFPGQGDRDAQRILAAATDAGVSRIDHLVITHFHIDHVGGVPGLAKLIPIRHFIDHGETVETDARSMPTFDAYKALAEGKRTIAKPGDKIAFGGANLDLTVVSAAGKVIEQGLKRGVSANFCEGAEQKPVDTTENSQSVGFLLTYGRFSFLDVGDLTWDREMQLACPVNKIGEVSLLQATHHGFSGGLSGSPALIWSLKPEAVVVNNGGRKGFSNDGYSVLAKIPGTPDIWQGHRGESNDEAHNTQEDMIANPATTGDKGNWIKALISADGSFTITNGRNNFSKSYKAR